MYLKMKNYMSLYLQKAYNRYYSYVDRIRNRRKIFRLQKLCDRNVIKFNFTWEIDTDNVNKCSDQIDQRPITIFGVPVHLDTIDWHKDYVSGFTYPLKRFDRIDISQWFNKGIDVKFPWEISRFSFGVGLAQKYRLTGDGEYYNRFKKLVSDWIGKNPFLFGVNWYCTMDVALRAVNWIVAVNIFSKKFSEDDQFYGVIVASLLQHAHYIYAFPEIKRNRPDNNHLVADYFGLLFLAFTLRDHPHSELWLKASIDGLITCIENQVNEDGSSFEGSIPYHRLVLEMFGYSAVLCRANNIDLPEVYHKRLFKMFEFTSAYLDHNGNAPQIGDNDSGRTIILHDSDEHDHSYLLDLGEHLFGYKFQSVCNKPASDYVCWLPRFDRIDILKAGIVPRKTERSILFPDGDCIFLKNENFMVSVSIIDRKKEFKTGHVHHDAGSIVVSYKGIPVIVDPGTYTYTRNLENRIQYVQYSAHNVPVIKNTHIQGVELPGFFNVRIENRLNLLDYTDTDVVYDHTYFLRKVQRKISIHSHCIKISDRADSPVISIFHLHPRVSLIDSQANKYYQFNVGSNVLTVISDNVLHLYEYDYSDAYGIKESSIKLCAESFGDTDIELEFS